MKSMLEPLFLANVALPNVGDAGPIYTETVLGRFPVEPWNTFSNIVFLFVIIYWAWRTRCDFKAHQLLVFSLPVIALGFVGGVLYHATRALDLWRLLDVIPIFMLVLLASIFLWGQLIRNRLVGLSAIVVPALLYRGVDALNLIPEKIFILSGYLFLGGLVIIPVCAHCWLKARRHWPWIAASLAAFAIALIFRQGDASWGRQLFPMGTHFLWHIFGGLASFALMGYLYQAVPPPAGRNPNN